MRIVLTGGSGFVGGALTRRLVGAGHEVVHLGRDRAAIDAGSMLPWDMNRHEPPPAPGGPVDAVAHLAQSRVYRHFPDDAPHMFEVNVAATAALLHWATRLGARRFTLVSSGAVYEPFAGSLREDAALAPSGYLGASKLAAEVVARPYQGALDLCVLRLFFPYGAGQSDRLIPLLVERIRSGAAISLAGEHGLSFTPTYVDDIAEVAARSIAEGWSGTYNVASPHGTSLRAVAEAIGARLGRAPRFERADEPALKIVPDLRRLAARCDLARFIAFGEGIRLMLAASEKMPQ